MAVAMCRAASATSHHLHADPGRMSTAARASQATAAPIYMPIEEPSVPG